MPSSLACSGICLSTSGVRTKPGQITLARTPCLAPSLATTLAQADQAVLGGDVGRLEHRCLLRVHRAHVDDAAAAAGLVHVRQAGLGREEGAVEVDRQHLLPVGVAELLDRMDDLDAGVADQDVDAAERGDDVAATPALTASSLQTSIATPIALPPPARISAAVASAAALFRSAMATLAPSRAKVSAISLPMPLAAPVTMADLFLSFMSVPFTWRDSRGRRCPGPGSGRTGCGWRKALPAPAARPPVRARGGTAPAPPVRPRAV